MANTTITNLPLAVSLTGTEQIPAVQSSSTVRLTVSQIATYTATIVAPPTLSIGNGISLATPGYGLYVDASTTLGQFAYGSGVFNAIKTATGTTGAPVLYNGFGGTPSSINLSNATNSTLPLSAISATGTPGATNFLRGDGTWSIPILTVSSTAISGATNGYLLYNNGGLLGAVAPTAASLSIGSPISNSAQVGYGLYVNSSTQLGQFAYGTGVFTALGNATNAASGLVTYSGSFGTPTSLTLTNANGLLVGGILATGTANATTYLRGDGSWQAIGGGGVTVNTGVTNQLSYYSGASAISGNPNATISTAALTLGQQNSVAGSLVLANLAAAGRSTTIQSSASASAAWTLTLPVSAGTVNYHLSTDGTGVTSWVAAATVTSVAVSGGTTGLTTSGGPITTSGTITLAGTLAVANGGTGQSTALTQYGVIYGSSTTAMGNTAAGTTGQVLIATTSAAPSWGQVPIAGGGTGQTTTALGTIVVGASASTTTNLAIGTTGQVLTVSGGTATWQNAASGGVSTISFGSTGLTPATATSGAVSVAGTLAAGFGGTGLATLTANSVLLGNGTSAVQLIAPGSSGNVLTSNGTTWTSATPAAGGAIKVYNVTTSGSWVKATEAPGFSANSRVYIQVWGAGGGGGKNATLYTGGGGGGGGAYNERWMTLSDLSATETVTIGAGGTGATTSPAAGGNGGTSSFGTKVYGYGASGTSTYNGYVGAYGGGSGGLYSASTSSNNAGTPNGGGWTGIGGPGGNGGGPCCGSGPGAGNFGVYGGGGGGGQGGVVTPTPASSQTSGATGGGSVWGGGGGGGRGGATGAGGSGAGGVSLYGGNGGAAAVSTTTNGSVGSIPGGGGGGGGGGTGSNGGNGASGQVIVTVFPA